MYKATLKYYALCMVMLTLFSSCRSILGDIYGERDVSRLNEAMVENIISKDTILSNHQNYYLDSSFVNACYARFSGSRQLLHDFLQPMQALYFDSLGDLISWHLNCYAGGFPNLKWNRGNVFATFPPKSQRPVTDSISLKALQPYLRKFDKLSNYKPAQPAALTIIVFWNYQMFKQSKRLIDLVEKNLKLGGNKQMPKLVFVNTDLMYKNWGH